MSGINRKIKRNKEKKKEIELCYCGSGKEYKNCHKNILQEEPMKPYELDKELKSSFSEKKCMSPNSLHHECSVKIIKAHTISKSANLKKIALNGHVYSFEKSIQALERNKEGFPIKKIGINNASIFNGFCSKHDKELFAIIEDEEMLFTDEQIFTLAYRTISNELYMKQSSQKNNIKSRNYDKGLDLELSLAYQYFINNNMQDELDLSIRDLNFIKNKYDEYLLSKNFEKQQYYIIFINKVPEIMNNTGWIPTNDFNNLLLADLSNEDEMFNTLTVSTINYNNQGAIVFSWLDVDEMDNKYCIDFIKSLNMIDNKDKSSAILEWILNCCENIYWSIDWWKSLSKSQQDIFIKKSRDMTQGQNLYKYHELDGFLDWEIISIKTNIDGIN